jgi:hypothetical protein
LRTERLRRARKETGNTSIIQDDGRRPRRGHRLPADCTPEG